MLEWISANKEAMDIITKILTFFIAFLGLGWTFYSGLRTLKNYTSNKKVEQISRLIQLFAEENKIKRLSSVNGLANNCDSLFKEIFLLCIIENNYHIKSTLQNALYKNSKKCYSQAIELNFFYTKILLGFLNDNQNNCLSRKEWNILIYGNL